MHPIRRAFIVPGLLVIVATILAACAGTMPPPLPSTVPAGPLVTVEFRGGECFAAPCGSTYTIERDGRVHAATKPPNDLGTVPANALATLDAAIRATDFVALKGHPFTGQCPTTYDGQELVFEFGAPGGVQRIASCEVDIDFGAPLFVALSTALGPFAPLPTT